MNNGQIHLFADNSEVSTLNKGQIKEMLGKAVISANIEGEIEYQDKQTIILYSPSESAKRMNEYKQEKAELEAREKNIEEEVTEKVEEKDKEENSTEEKKEEKPKRKVRGKQMKLDEIAVDQSVKENKDN